MFNVEVIYVGPHPTSHVNGGSKAKPVENHCFMVPWCKVLIGLEGERRGEFM